jgi:phage terminase large subunit
VTAIARARDRLRGWRENPVQFVVDEFKVEPDVWQREVLEAFPSQAPDKKRIAMQACAGPGKSAVDAWCAWNFLACYGERGEHPKGAAVSITGENLRDNLWAELAKWRDRSEFLTRAFEWTSSRVFAKDHPETWFMSARSWPKTANADEQGQTLSGLHAKFVLYLLDESGGIPPSVLRAAEQGLSNCAWGKILQSGNPISTEGVLYQAATLQRHLWHLVTITGDPEDPRRSSRIDAAWAAEQIATYGRDNPWVMAYILGLFPSGAINGLLGPDEVEVAMKRVVRADAYNFAAKVLGVDVARFGDDRTVIWPRQGIANFKPIVMRNARTHDIAGRVAQAQDRWGAHAIFVDDTGGWGAGVIDALLLGGRVVIPVNFSGKADDPRYYNKRAEMAFRAQAAVRGGCALPPIPALSREITAHTYFFHKGKFQITEKDQVKKLIQVSPDMSDAWWLTYAQPILPPSAAAAAGLHEPGTNGHTVDDYDPFDDTRP